MKQAKTITIVLSGVVLGLTAVLSGCGTNEARQDSAPAEEVQVPPSPTVDPDGEGVEADLERRRLALEQRERTIARLETNLQHRVRELETRIDEVETRETVQTIQEPPPALAAPPREPELVTVALPASTRLDIELLDGLSSEASSVGDRVRARVIDDVFREGLLAVPAGSRVVGQIYDIVPQRKIGGQARLAVKFDRLELPSGETLAIQAFLDAEGRRQTKKDAVTIGGSTAGGALLGRVLSDDKSKGTAIGAVVGAAVGTAVAAKNRADPIVLDPGTVTELFLDAPLELAVAGSRRPEMARSS